VSGTGAAGAVSGFEVVGATVTITFSDGTTLTSSLYEEGSLGGSQAVVAPNAPATPSIDVQGVTLETVDEDDNGPALTGAVVSDPNQTITVSGPAGTNVSLMLVDSRLFIASGDPPFDVTANELPYYANEAMAKALYTGVIGAGGTVDIPVTLMMTDGGSNPDGGQNRVVAVLSDGPYAVDQQVSMTSNSFVLVYDPNAGDAELVGTISLQGRTDHSGDLVVEVYETNTTNLVDSFTPTADANGEFTISGLQPDTYDVWVKHDQYLAVLETITLTAGSNSADFGQLAAGDANNDNFVSALDFSILSATFNKQEGDLGYDGRADFNGDDAVTALDFSLLSSNFNTAGETPGN
jgi:hypothetical protein